MSSAGMIHFIYNETIVSSALPSSSVDYNWFTGINVWNLDSNCKVTEAGLQFAIQKQVIKWMKVSLLTT